MRERRRCPRHPGYILKTLYLEPSALTITQLAQGLGVSRKTVSAIINEHTSITPEMALRLAQAFPHSTPESWMTLQRNYDLWQVAHRTSEWRTIHPVVESADNSNLAVTA